MALDNSLSLLLPWAIFPSIVAVGERRRACHLQWEQEPNFLKVLMSNKIKISNYYRDREIKGAAVWKPLQKCLRY